jgi:hypothetical protein
VLLFIARMLWGAAWGIINLTMTAYAYGNGTGAGVRIGIARAVSSVGAFAALVAVGPLCIAIGPHKMFVLYGLIGLTTIPLAFLLPPLRAAASDVKAAWRWTLTPLNALFFVVSFGADGVLGATISVLLAEFMPTSSAIIGAGLLLALQRLVAIVLALFSGPLTDRVGAHRLLLPCTLAIAAGFAVIAMGHVNSGTIIVILARALLGPRVPCWPPKDRPTASPRWPSMRPGPTSVSPPGPSLASSASPRSATPAAMRCWPYCCSRPPCGSFAA